MTNTISGIHTDSKALQTQREKLESDERDKRQAEQSEEKVMDDGQRDGRGLSNGWMMGRV